MFMLKNKNDLKVLVPNLSIADTLWTRTKGLLGTSEISESAGLWIHECRSIHTFFMNYAIDCVFINQKLEVVSIIENIKPFRITFPRMKANSVIELKAGQAKKIGFKIGDSLYVDAQNS